MINNLKFAVKMKISLLFLILISTVGDVFANESIHAVMRQNGKINVVFGVILIVFIGLVVYLIQIDKKIKKLENKINHE